MSVKYNDQDPGADSGGKGKTKRAEKLSFPGSPRMSQPLTQLEAYATLYMIHSMQL